MDLYFELPQDLPAEWNNSKKIKRAIADELARQGISGEVDWKPDPLSTKKDRELILAILAVGATSVLVAHAVKKVLDNINPEKPTVVYEKKSEPVLADGKPVVGADGQQLMKYTETPVVVQPGGSSESISLTAFKVFEIRSSSEKHAPGENPPKAPSPAMPPQQGKST
ncbi:MAG: hypothetical protein WBQ94_08875 [Terracidiphilus sp.]